MNEELQSMNDELHTSNEVQREQQDHYYRLNRFMGAVLGSLNAGVTAVDQDLRVLAWNAKAEDLWGIRTDEAWGQHLFSLDIGLPLEPLRPVLKRQLADGADPDVLRLDAVNRRGRSIAVQVTVTRLEHSDGDEGTGALLMMEVVGE
jgi:two-component system CheB/CheR fusion protein